MFSHLSETDYETVYKTELSQRKQFSYPPFVRFSEIELRSNDETVLDKESEEIAEVLFEKIKSHKFSVTILGPAKPLVSKIEHIHIRKIYLKSADIKETIFLFQYIATKKYFAKRYFVPNVITL
jgi:primosomal protein N'